MASEIPVIREFIPCREVTLSPDGREVSLVGPFYQLTRLVADPSEREFWFYVLMTNGRGEHEFAIEWVRFDRGIEHTVLRTEPIGFDMGQDPTLVFGTPMTMTRVDLRHAGQFTFHLLCDDQRVAQQHVEVR